MKIQYFCYPFLKHAWLFRKRIQGHQAFNLFQLLFSCRASQVAPPGKRGHVSPKACHTGFHYTSPSMQCIEILPTQGICNETPLATRIHTNYSCPFCHTDFINLEEFIEHMEVCSGTDQEPEVLKLICPYCQQTFDMYDKIENHIGIHIMRWIRHLHNLSQQLQEPGRVNLSHEHLSMNRL